MTPPIVSTSDGGFRHEVEPVDYTTVLDQDDIEGYAELPATVYSGTCEALEPQNDPSITAIDVTVPDGSTWAKCPNCDEEIRMDLP